MMDNVFVNDNRKISLSSSEELPFRFTVVITEEAQAENSKCGFEVTATDPFTQSSKTCYYELTSREHSSYLDLFEKLSKDFGLRLPQNRQPSVQYDFEWDYRELITKNLIPGMLYGYGDPAVLQVQNSAGNKPVYYLLSTSNDAPDSFPICVSSNLVDWEFVGFVFPKGNKPGWAADGEFLSDYWAPEMHKIEDEFRVYFVAREKETLELCIGMARSQDPRGPFTADKTPILKGNMIDPHIFYDKGTALLYWKEDNNGVWPSRLMELLNKNPELIKDLFGSIHDQITASFMCTIWPWIKTLKAMEGFLVLHILIEAITAEFFAFEKRLIHLAEKLSPEIQKSFRYVLEVMKTPVYVQRLTTDGSALTGEIHKIIENDLAWEAHLVEGIWLTEHNNKYYLFYSGNDFSTDQYGIGVAIADAPTGPFKKMEKPILKSTEKWWGPGHPSMAIAPDGKHWLFLHGFFPGKAGYKEFRSLLAVPLKLEADNVLLEK